MSAHHYDLIVIGSGPAGEKGAVQAAQLGKKVALIEREHVLGGVAANKGSLLSKTLRETALALIGFRQRGLQGVTMTLKEHVTANDFLNRERLVRQLEQARIRAQLKIRKSTIQTASPICANCRNKWPWREAASSAVSTRACLPHLA